MMAIVLILLVSMAYAMNAVVYDVKFEQNQVLNAKCPPHTWESGLYLDGVERLSCVKCKFKPNTEDAIM